jgi:hypothetical protein
MASPSDNVAKLEVVEFHELDDTAAVLAATRG